MSDHVFVVSEWVPKEGCEEELWDCFKELMASTLEQEPGCIRAHVTRQVPHPGATGESKYKIILLQEYESVDAFDAHCGSDYVRNFADTHLGDESIIVDWRCRLFSEARQ